LQFSHKINVDSNIVSRYLGSKTTISLDRWLLVYLIDHYRNGALISWEEFSDEVKTGHVDRMGSPTRRTEVPTRPMQEDFFYSNPQECLPPITINSRDVKNVMSMD
jgi:hypothetical protein